MIPSLVAGELQDALVEYLTTTYALTDDDAAAALNEFLVDQDDGIFRGPYLRVRRPFASAPADAEVPLDWVPEVLSNPYQHQLQAWQRLAGRGRVPDPTLLTTGTGSGKTEAFLVPIIDHCRWARQQDIPGIKALLLYPMNALVEDQQRRIAEYLGQLDVPVRGGVFIGDDRSTTPRSAQTADGLVNDRQALLDDPPDILLTNYKMLDRLLTSPRNLRLWAHNRRPEGQGQWQQPLTYLVLDEFHTYDGAQGTDVAMLLRRLGHRLGIATAGRALDGVAPIGTSATLGSGTDAVADIATFATRVFGIPVGMDAVIPESRQSVDEIIEVDHDLPLPGPSALAAAPTDEMTAIARLLLVKAGENPNDLPLADPVWLGERLSQHFLVRALLEEADQPARWEDVVTELARHDRGWDREHNAAPEVVREAAAKLLALVSLARRREPGGRIVPLFPVEMQIWIREVSRLFRLVDSTPIFRWADGAPADGEDRALPAVFCRECGRSGWMGVVQPTGIPAGGMEPLDGGDPRDVYRASVEDRRKTRALIRATGHEDDVLWLDPTTLRLSPSDANSDDPARVPVLVSGYTHFGGDEGDRERAAELEECPSCRAQHAIRFVGSRVTTLAAVSITQLFGSEHVADDERKLLAFTDSVQDASHRAAFFSARAHRFNQRTILAGVLDDGPLTIDEAAQAVIDRVLNHDEPAQALFSVTPPDVVREEILQPLWTTAPPKDSAVEALRERLEFELALEVGLRGRFGRTLETTGVAAAEVHVDLEGWQDLVTHLSEAVQHEAVTLELDRDVEHWLRGLLERIRLRGGILHHWLDPYLADAARRWKIWGGRPDLMPAFPTGISAPTFPSSTRLGNRHGADAIVGRQTWFVDWTVRVLGIDATRAPGINRTAMDLLVDAGIVHARRTEQGDTVLWGIPPERILIHPVASIQNGDPPSNRLRCTVCATRHYVPVDNRDAWVGKTCLRYRCTGVYEPMGMTPGDYYRRLYRSGRIRRVVAAEHTGLLSKQQRDTIEHGFREENRPDAPNVLAATPTLEMGIDIGDLSAVMLTSVPRTQASYVQRVGRAGRKTGNAFVTTFAESDPMSLYHLTDPVIMMAGDIPAPACHLDAREILRRQYLAHLVDCAAEEPATYGVIPPRIDQTVAGRTEQDGWVNLVLEHGAEQPAADHFLSLFGDQLAPRVRDDLVAWTAGSTVRSMATWVNHTLDRWADDLHQRDLQRDRVREAIKRLEERGGLDDDEQQVLDRLHGELRGLSARIRRMRQEETLGALERLGLLPNYTLVDDTATLTITLYHPPGEDGTRQDPDVAERVRPASQAIREFAPGNAFYVDAHKVRVDAVDVGGENEPNWATRRLCAACGYGTPPMVDASSLAACPRCGDLTIGDSGSIVKLLPVRAASADEAEDRARTSDDSDQRDQRYYNIVTTVDIDPADVTAAWVHKGSHTVFGVEAAREAVVRTINPGSQGSRRMRIGGLDLAAELFTVCVLCGGALGVHGRRDDPDDARHHRGWCKVRSGSRKPNWVELALVHELHTEAVRILLPVADFEARERIASFQAAIMLGLRESFGGDPDHLTVQHTQHPAADGGLSQYLVIHDRVPGGTGYLHRLAEPEQLHTILVDAQRVISTCRCQQDGRPGCHRCLYSQVRSRDVPYISRQMALEMLTEILTDYELEPAPNGTISGVRLEPVRQSELERLFKTLLHRWADDASGVSVQSMADTAAPQRRIFDVRFSDGPRWRISEQKDLRPTHQTVPDFWAERADVTDTPPVAIYLDGWAFHGSDPAAVAGDADKRAGLREAEVLVWSLSWDDVDTHRRKLVGLPTTSVRGPLSEAQAHTARQVLQRQGPAVRKSPDAIARSATARLFDFLRHPDGWRDFSVAVAMSLGSGQNPTPTASSSAAIDAFVKGHELPVDLAGAWQAFAGHSASGLRTIVTVHGSGGVGAGVLYDTTRHDSSDDGERQRWVDWLHLGNMLQFLGPSNTVVTATGATDAFDVPPSAAAEADAAPYVVSPSRAHTALGELLDDDVRDLVQQVLERGAGDGLVAGHELAGGVLVEAAWPELKVGVLTDDVGPAHAEGWDLRTAAAWTVDELLAALEGGRS